MKKIFFHASNIWCHVFLLKGRGSCWILNKLKVNYLIVYQPLRSGRILHKVNF